MLENKPLIIIAALLALFLGALDALIVSAAMPSIVTDLGGLSLIAGFIPPIFSLEPCRCRYSASWLTDTQPEGSFSFL